jgi:hypothetical protein
VPPKKPREQWIAISVPALVDADTWDKAQAQLSRNAALSFRNNAKHNYLLRCLLTCRTCGLAMFGRTCRATGSQAERRFAPAQAALDDEDGAAEDRRSSTRGTPCESGKCGRMRRSGPG